MGYFREKFGFGPLIEAEIDGQTSEDQPTDYTVDGGGEEAPPPPTDEGNAENNPPEEQPADNQQPTEEPPVEGGEETTDYTEMGDEEGTGEEGGGEGSGGEEAPPPPEEEKPVDELKQQEEEMYGLSPDKLDIRHKELKKQFLDMYDSTSTIIDKISDAAISEESLGAVEFITETLSKLRTTLSDYLNNVYSGNSYIENVANFNRFLAVLNGVNKILEDLDKNQDK